MKNAPLWLAIILPNSFIIGILAGILFWLGGANVPNAIISGAAAFGSTVLLIFAIIYFVVSRCGSSRAK